MNPNSVAEPKQILTNGERFGVVGGGNMTKALVFPLIEKGLLSPEQIVVSATTQATLASWRELGCATTTDNKLVTSTSDIVLWGVKPQMLSKAIPQSWNLTEERYSKCSSLHISVLAGITLETFKQRLQDKLEVLPRAPYKLRCIRTMPNIGASVGSGCVVFTPEPEVIDEDRQFMHDFFGPTGLYFEVPEYQMNAYSGLMGCGIGFMFPVIEGLSDGAVKMGIPRAASLKLAAQVMKGAGELLLAENRHPGELKDRVCSPGGSTICGVAALEENGVRNAFIKAVEASTKRGEELGQLK